jgi:fructose-bisphosphate aldolase class II
MKTYREYIQDALKGGYAIGHFNISNIEGVWAIANASRKLSVELERPVPVIVGVSEGERDYFGVPQIVAVVQSIRKAWAVNGEEYPIFLNADHTYSYERVIEAIDAGFDSVIFDGTELPFEKNVELAKKSVAYAHDIKERTGRDVIIECELGYIGKSSKVLEGIPEGVKITDEFLTKPEEAVHFVELTGVDMLAPAVGNIHGMLKGGKDPALNTELVGKIHTATQVPLVLHGASGNSAEDIQKSISGGVAIVHVNTELRVAFRNGLAKALNDSPNEMSPYKYARVARDEMERVVMEKIKIFFNNK